MIDLNDLAYRMRNVACARKMNGAKIDTDTFMMLKHCATEVVEATEAYIRYGYYADNFESELADIIACVLIICANEPTIDIEKALQECFEKNRKRAESSGDKL